MKVSSAIQKPDLYPDRHLNVFVPYGTHDLDYNVTRAVISTLRWSVPALTREFLAELAGVKVDGEPVFQFDLQASDFEDYDPSRAKRKVVLGISGKGKAATRLPSLDLVDMGRLHAALAAPAPAARLEAVRQVLLLPDLDPDELAVLAHAVAELSQGSMPDGWIFSVDGQACVLIEAKLLALLLPAQLDRHAEVWFGRRREGEDLVLTTWAAVATFFGKRREHPDPRTAFLCRQVADYIDLLGFAPFEGFKPYDFDGDAIGDSLPKFRRFVGEVLRQATADGLPLGEESATATGSRIAFTNPALLGELRLDLATEGLKIGWRVGESVGGRFAGPAGAEALLQATDDGKKALAAGVKLASEKLTARVERLVDGPFGASVDAVTYSKAVTPDDLGEALQELRLQHPRGGTGRTPRRGALVLEATIARDDALTGRDPIVVAALKIVRDAVRVAEKLVPVS